MNVLEQIKTKTIIVCNTSYQYKLLQMFDEKEEIYDVKFFSMQEFIGHFYFSYDDLTIAYLIENYNYSYDIAVTYLKSLIYIETSSNIKKLDFLYNLKCDLIEKQLIYYDIEFKNYIKNFDIIFLGIPYFDKLQEHMICQLKNICSVTIINDLEKSNKLEVYEALTIDDEISFVADKISSLINDGVDINKIKIANVDGDYTSFLTKIFSLYNIPIDVEKHYMYGLEIVNRFLELYDDNDFNTIFDLLLKEYLNDEDIIKKLVDIINRHVLIEDKTIKKQFIINDLKNTNIFPAFANSVKVIDYLNDYIDDSYYVFLLNFNQNAIPLVKKDEEYITDMLKEGLLLDLVSDLNIKIKNATVSRIKQIDKLVITYKLQTPYRNYYPANLVKDMNMIVLPVEFSNICYSPVFAKIKLSSMLNKFITYGIIDEKLILYNSNFDIDYLTYNNKYNSIDIDLLNKYVDENIVLSYSSMNNYYLCKFKYYINNILKLDIYEETFAIYIGNLFHYVLQYHFKDGRDVDELIESYLKDNPLKNSKEVFFIEHLKKEIYFIVNTISEQMKECGLDCALYEDKVVVSLSDEVNITFKGFIDKLLYKKYDDKTVVAIIDYKTGNTDIDMKLIPYGLSLQLPVYLYLAKNNANFSNVVFAGFYLQKILHELPTIDGKQSFADIKKNELKLNGYSNFDESIIYEFDHSYKDSRVIKSMKVKNDGNYFSYAKVLDNSSFDKIVEIVHDKIIEAGLGIKNGDFAINPKEVDDINLSCSFCKFKDLCFKSESDKVRLEKSKDLSFLGGDTNA